MSIGIGVVLLEKYDLLEPLAELDEVLATLADVSYALGPLFGRCVCLDF